MQDVRAFNRSHLQSGHVSHSRTHDCQDQIAVRSGERADSVGAPTPAAVSAFFVVIDPRGLQSRACPRDQPIAHFRYGDVLNDSNPGLSEMFDMLGGGSQFARSMPLRNRGH
jgi:hypothetical protein